MKPLASNSSELMRSLIGKRIVGVSYDNVQGAQILIFADSAFAFHGTFWGLENTDVEQILRRRREELDIAIKELRTGFSDAGAPEKLTKKRKPHAPRVATVPRSSDVVLPIDLPKPERDLATLRSLDTIGDWAVPAQIGGKDSSWHTWVLKKLVRQKLVKRKLRRRLGKFTNYFYAITPKGKRVIEAAGRTEAAGV